MIAHRYAWVGIDDSDRTDIAQVEFGRGGMRAAGSSLARNYTTSWALDVDERWRTRRVSVTATGDSWTRHLDLTRSPDGKWAAETVVRGAADLPAPGIADGTDLRGALDCDLGKCPLTNVMPIRRLDLLRARVEDTPLVMAWIDVPSLRVIRSDQVYGTGSRDGTVRYTSYSRDFSAELTVDEDGVVLEYPHLARRL